MSELYFLGTGGSVATLERDNTSFLLKSQDSHLLVDCPGSAIQKIKKIGLDPSSVQTILITHIHPDHVYGLPSFIHSLMLEDREVKLYGSEETVNFCRSLLDLFNLLEREMKIRVAFFPLQPGERTRIDDSLELGTLSVPHSPSSLACRFSFLREGKELLYSGDTPIYAPLFEAAEGIDYLIHDCSAPSRFFHEYPALRSMHTDSLELGKHAQQAGVECLIPCHFFGEVAFSLTEVEQEIRENFMRKLIVPMDLQKIPL